jgi:hypothetical protein
MSTFQLHYYHVRVHGINDRQCTKLDWQGSVGYSIVYIEMQSQHDNKQDIGIHNCETIESQLSLQDTRLEERKSPYRIYTTQITQINTTRIL